MKATQEGYTAGRDEIRRKSCFQLHSPRLSFREKEKAREERSLRSCTDILPE